MSVLFGKKGVDTTYERDLFERRVKLEYPEKDGSFWLPSDLMEGIQRARNFNISNVIAGYENLLTRIEEAMKYIEKREKGTEFLSYKRLLEKQGYTNEVIKIENENTDIRGKKEFELYSILFRLKKSITMQIDFQYDNYASQFIIGRSLKDLELVEQNSISRLASLQSDLYTNNGHSHDDVEDEDQFEVNQQIIRELSLLHITNGDISFSHLNRQNDLDIILTQIERLTYNSKELIGNDIEYLIYSVHAMSNKSAIKTQLLVQFAEIREQHEGTKLKYNALIPSVEKYASEAAYMQKQIKEKATEDTMMWLYEKEDGQSEAFDGLAEILVKGITKSEENYEKTNGSMTHFYKSESDYFASQVDFIQNKEKIRLYFSIIEHLEDISEISSEWVHNYLTIHGYSPSAEV